METEMLPSPPAGSVAAPLRSCRRMPTIWIAYALLGTILAGYLALLLVNGENNGTLIEGWMVDALEILGGCLCLARGFVRRTGRAVPLVLGAALLSWALGDLTLTVESLGGATPPVPSLADAFYLGFFPIAYVAIVLLVRGETRRLTTPSWLDGGVAGLGAAALCAAFVFPDVLKAAGGSSLEVATNLAYPVGDLLLLALVVGGVAVLSGRKKGPWLLLAAGAVINIAGDTSNLFGDSFGAMRVGSVLNSIAWPASILLMSAAVWLPRGPSNPWTHQRPPGFLLPGLAALSALVVLGVGTFCHLNHTSTALATATLALVGVRLALSAHSLRSLTERRYEESLTDELTSLGNRRDLFRVIDAYFADETVAPTPGRSLAFLFVDLNRFKELNDSFGHPAGDEVLKQLGTRLKALTRSTDALIRFGGDEFAVVLPDADVDHATVVAEQITASLEEPFALEAVNPRLTASIGIAIAPADATDSAGLVWCADAAMYRAKAEGRPYAHYEHEQDFNGDSNHLRLADELRVAIQQGQLILHYQPQLDLSSDEISSVEALVRWPHPRLGLVPPLKFLPVAEEAGLMRALTTWVLEHALEQCVDWRRAGRCMSVSVNVSASNLLDEGFVPLVDGLLRHYELPPDSLVLEITETSVITDFERVRLVIERFHALHIVISVDDFGAGFTSLAYLSDLAVCELKLDRTFITPLASGESERGTQLVRATIHLAHALDMRVIAEGVEDEATLRLLAGFGCDLAQGFFIDKPKPAPELALRSATREAAGSQPPMRHRRRHTRLSEIS
jgi:diguanylate cyclase (GGDEF)-like protein